MNNYETRKKATSKELPIANIENILMKVLKEIKSETETESESDEKKENGSDNELDDFMLIYTKMINEQKSFKHDLNNLIQAMNGYIENNDLKGLKNYFNEFLKEVNKINFLESLTHTVKGNPGLNGILAQKFSLAKEVDVTLRYEVDGIVCNLGKDCFNICRMLGVLLDNAIEAAKESEDKNVLVNMHNEDVTSTLVIEVKNNYDTNSGLDIKKIFDKNYTTKDISKKEHGFGLWKVSEILSENKHFGLETTVNEYEFSQVLKIKTKNERFY